MILKWFTRLLIFVFTFGTQTVSAQVIRLTTQAQVDAFTGTKVTGSLVIRSEDITDLSPLNSIDTITHGLFFEYNRKLKTLNGFDNLLYIGGSLIIDSNTELDSISTFGKLKMVKGPLVLRANSLLRECCVFYPILDVFRGGTIISANKGCKNEKELRENCDADTDNDGVDDSMDACPNDPLKINPGICGCGQTELDSDQDGTPDCNDACPNDPNKTIAGDCGCGKIEKDSDGDGVADCDDECPYNPAITKVGICGCVNPRITSLSIDRVGACNDQGTPSALDDTYTIDLTISFEGAPSTGKILITGGVSAPFSFSGFTAAKSYQLTNIPFKANGKLIEVKAEFEGNPNCRFRRVFGIFGPSSCSTGACNPPNSISIDTETTPNSAILSWSDLGIGTTYEVGYRPEGTTNWATESVETTQLLINNLADYTNYEYRIRSYCDGQKFSAYQVGQFTTGGPECKIIRASVQNINCANNQTPEDASDDYFTFDLYVEGTNTGSGFTINNVIGENNGQYNTIQTFRTANGTLGQGDIEILITDKEVLECQSSAILTDPGVCSSDCQIDYISIDNSYRCYDNGSFWTKGDDYFKADLTVYFKNAPTNGELKLIGQTSRRSISTEALQNVQSYTFEKVRIPATGLDFYIGASFTNGLDCEYTTDFEGVTIRDDKICRGQCNILNAQVQNIQCADDDFLTFELVVTGINLSNSYQVSNVAGVSKGIYNQPSFFRTTSNLDGQTIELEITDSLDTNCKFLISLDNKCTTSQSKVNSNFGIKLLSQSVALNAYPNPAREQLTIDYESNSENVFIEVFDLLGQKVIEQKLNEKTINISSLTKGLYHLVVREGKKIQTKKFIKE